MADRRDESRLAALRRRVSKLRSDDSPQGVDARTRGEDRSAVDARRVDVDEKAVSAAAEGDFEGVPTASASDEPSSRVAKAKARAAAALKERADSESAKAAAKRALEGVAADEGAPDDYGTTGTKTERIAKRATDAASIRAPMGGSLRTVGDERVVTDMARAGSAETEGLLSGAPLSFRGGRGRRSGPSVALGVGFADAGMGDDDMGFEDPFGLAGDDDRDGEDDDDDAGAFPGVSILGGEE